MEREQSDAAGEEHDLAADEDVETKAKFDDKEAQLETEKVSEHHESAGIEEHEDALENNKERMEVEHKKAKRRKKGT
ncbi:MAG: hypothetical protein ACHQ1H_09475 [Nitrososphaerales archaeon]